MFLAYNSFMYNKHFSKEPTEKQKIGAIGEDCACKYLKNHGYKIVDRNYLKQWGEIDIVAKKDNKMHFVEVKSVSREISGGQGGEVTRETREEYRPEENIHPRKLQRLGRVVQSYLLEKDISDDVDWQFDVATVYIDMAKRISRVEVMEDVVL